MGVHPESAAFYLVAGMTIGSALMVVIAKNMVRALFMFFVTLFSIGGLYLFSLADFVALTQVIVYVGGVLVLMLFAFMLSDKELLSRTASIMAKPMITPARIMGLLVAAGFFVVLILVFRSVSIPGISWTGRGPAISAIDDTVPMLGISMMTRYLLPFEAVSVFLLMALIGAVHLSRKEKAV
jgi:NADH-quinone oxidoreductase subunit J